MQKSKEQATSGAMKWTSLAVGAVLIVVLGLIIRSRVAPTHHVTLSQIPRVLEQLSLSTTMPTFAVFMFNSPEQPAKDDVLNIQLSMENGHPGFDWVLISPKNIADKQRFVDFVRSAGYRTRSLERNGVQYVRVEDGDLAQLCKSIIIDMYKLPATSTVEMIVEGFEWQP